MDGKMQPHRVRDKKVTFSNNENPISRAQHVFGTGSYSLYLRNQLYKRIQYRYHTVPVGRPENEEFSIY